MRLRLIAGISSVFTIGVFVVAQHICINHTPSLPRGIYWHSSESLQKVTRGDIVLICPPQPVAEVGVSRGYIPAGWCPGGSLPLLKILAAAGGDTVDVSPSGERVNGHLLPSSMRIERDAHAQKLALINPGRYTLSANMIWLYSPVQSSWDSRYFGAVTTKPMIELAQPLLVFGPHEPFAIAQALRAEHH